jgi:hypothetical protein
MEQHSANNINAAVILACDGDPTIREGDWLRLWTSAGLSFAHEVWVGRGGTVYENSGPGGDVRRNGLANVLAGRRLIHIVARTEAADLDEAVAFAEARLGTPWSAFYTCQDFASEVATGKPQSFQRDGILGVLLAGGLLLLFAQQPPRSRSRRKRSSR